MKAIVISLPHAQERRRRIARRFSETGLPFEFLDAVDAEKMTEADMARVDTRYRRRWGLRPVTSSELACWRSHVSAITRAGAGPDPMTAIFEDDAIPLPELPAVLDALERAPVSFDLVSLVRRGRKPLVAGRPLAAGRSMGRVRYSEYCAAGYVITREAAAYLAGRMKRMRLPVDMELLFFWVHRLDLFFLDAPVVEHDEITPSQLAAGRTVETTGWTPPRHRRLAYLVHTAVSKRIGFRNLVNGKIRRYRS